MDYVFLVLYFLWLIFKHILIISAVFMAFAVPAYIFANFASKIKSVLILPIIVIFVAFNTLIFSPLASIQIAILALVLIQSIIYTIRVIRTFKIKAVRKLSFYKEDGIIEASLYLTSVFLAFYYININSINTIVGSISILQFSNFKIHFYILLFMLIVYGLYPSSVTLRDYKFIKSLIKKNGFLSESLLYSYAIEGLSDSSDSKKEKEKKAKEQTLRYIEICENISKYENELDIINLTQVYYFNDSFFENLDSEINNTQMKLNDVLKSLINKFKLNLSENDFKILINDYMPKYRFVNKNNESYIINVNSQINKKVCDCCNTICNKLIVNEFGKFCSNLCLEVEIGFIDNDKVKQNSNKIIDSAILGVASRKVGALYNKQEYFNNKAKPTKHGYAAEVVNTDIDKISFKNASVVGKDNAKNGPDRIVNNVEIQTKYYDSANKSIDAGFDSKTKSYKYINSDGKPMPLEVPKDQYEDAVRHMAKKIEEGKVLGYKNPKRATELVKSGGVTYNQAKNITKSMTIESLVYDGYEGVLIGLESMSIGGTIAFFTAIWNGKSFEEAFESGVITGGRAFAIGTSSSIVSTQFAKMKVGQDIKNNIIKKYGKDNMTKIVSNSNAALSFIFLTYKDFYDFFNNSISTTQLFKNLTVAGSSAATGFMVGMGIGSIPGAVVGGVVGSLVGMTTKSTLDHFLEDDIVKLKKIFEFQFENHAREYMLLKDDILYINKKLSEIDMNNVFRQMYKSDNKYQYVSILLKPYIIKCYEKRY